MVCWRCRARRAARQRLRPWKRGTLCRECDREVSQVLVEAFLTVLALRAVNQRL